MSSNKINFQNKTVIIGATLSFDQMAALESIMNNAVLEQLTTGDSVSVQQGHIIVSMAEAFGLDVNPTIDSLNDSQEDFDSES